MVVRRLNVGYRRSADAGDGAVTARLTCVQALEILVGGTATHRAMWCSTVPDYEYQEDDAGGNQGETLPERH